MKNIIKKDGVYWPSEELKKNTFPNNKDFYEIADKDPIKFWETLANDALIWWKPWKTAYKENFPFFRWFSGGKLNACYNSVDRHIIEGKKDKTAILWIPEPVKEKPIKLTYGQLYDQVNRFANVLKSLGVKKGDVVGVYLPLIPEVVITVLACARIGAIHSVVFSAFSSEALKARLIDGKSKVLITSDGYYRKGEKDELLTKVTEAIKGTKVKSVIVANRLNLKLKNRKFLAWKNLMKKAKPECQPAIMDSTDPLFILYTSGTTGKPKGVVHDTGGYLTQSYWTTRWNFDIKEDTIYWCTADIGWITGHTYMVYGPLLNGITSVMYEGLVNYPTPSRIWDIINQNKIDVLYTAPTAIRVFMASGDKWVKKCPSLRIIGTVGEPIDNKTWLWYFNNIGKQNCPVIDTWWQTESGGNLINALPGIGPFKPSFAGFNFPGTRHLVVDEKGKPVKDNTQGYLVQASPFFPGMLINIWRNPKKYKTYFKFGKYYFTGDGAIKTEHGFRIVGRIDDVMNVAGHRISTGELEDALYKHKGVSEAAIAPKPDKLRGQVPIAFVKLKRSTLPDDKTKKELLSTVVKFLGPTSKPHEIYFVTDLPKTRSGKIMRRIMRSLLDNEPVKGLQTLVNPKSVDEIRKILGK
ncbi:MAG: acetate--CoA ligase [Candidatus Woesearchaeota archaeon]